MSAQRALALGLLLLPVFSCDDSPAAPAVLPLVPSNGTHLFLTVQTAPGAILTGGRADVVVTVARDGNDAYDGEVSFELAPAEGLTSAPVAIDRTATSATLSIMVAAARRHGALPLRIVATSKDRSASGEVSLTIVVRGAPGSLDTSFGDGGMFVLGEPDADATAVAFQADGKIVLGGRIGSDAAVVRLTPDGRPDPSFGASGRARTRIAGLVSTHDAVILPDGAIVLGGNGPARAFLARFTPEGAPDPRFGSQGVVLTAQSRSSMLLATDGELTIAGQSGVPADENAADIVRVHPSGVPDYVWGRAGELALPFSTPACALGAGNCFASAMHPKPVGQLTVCASRGDGVNLREIFQGGVEDKNIDLTTTAADFSRCTAVLNNTLDDFWAAGAREGNLFQILHFRKSLTGGPLVVDRFRPATVVPPEAALGCASRLVVGGAGVLVASADATPGGGVSRMALVRVDANTLKLDPRFGGGGYVMAPVASAPQKSHALAVQADGRIIVAGTSGDMLAFRYWP